LFYFLKQSCYVRWIMTVFCPVHGAIPLQQQAELMLWSIRPEL
jgi:hypothetical protein